MIPNITQIAAYQAIEMRLPKTGETAFILPELGGTVYQIHLGSNPTPILETDTPEELELNPKFRGRILFPFNDRIPNATYSFAGKDYKLPVNCPEDGSAIHGLIYNRPMSVVFYDENMEQSRLILATAFNKDEFTGYPFALTLEMEYILEPNQFVIRFRISNDGNTPAPLALGWHPYFNLGDEFINDHYLNLSANTYVAVDNNLLPTGETPSVHDSILDFNQPQKIDNVELDLALIHTGKAIADLTFESKQLTVSQDPKFFPYFQLYIPENRASIAIEPVSGATDSFNRPNLGLQILPPGTEIKTWMKVQLEDL